MKSIVFLSATMIGGLLASTAVAATTLTIATVNNADIVRMQQLSDNFTKSNPDIQINFVTMEENSLRQKLTTDIATKGGQYDVMMIGPYELPIWAKKGWILPLTSLNADKDYDTDDLIPKIRAALSYKDQLYASPFYGESSFTYYRTDLFQKAGLTMPASPTWDFIRQAADKITDRGNGINGICLRGKAGWGENMGFLAAAMNSFGGRWFDENWMPQLNSPEEKEVLTWYVDIMKADGPAGASSNGYNENLALFQQGKCGIWIDSTVPAGSLLDPKQSTVADKTGFALAPEKGLGKRANWIWSWALAVPAGSQKVDAAEKFIAWATSKHYIELVAGKDGWGNAPPGARTSLYNNPEYMKVAAPFAKLTLDSINAADSDHPTVKPVPYKGVTYPSIPEYPAIGTTVGQIFSAALTGNLSVDEALQQAQDAAVREMTKGGYLK